MKISELMVGDWVYANGEPHLVSILVRYCDDNHKVTDSIGCQGMGKSGEFIPVRFEPIPLTEEILEVNGFDIIQDGDSLTIWKQKDDEYGNEVYDITIYASKGVMRFDTSIRYRGTIRKNIYYVHELQHALRLCGLTKLADNFKIE